MLVLGEQVSILLFLGWKYSLREADERFAALRTTLGLNVCKSKRLSSSLPVGIPSVWSEDSEGEEMMRTAVLIYRHQVLWLEEVFD